MNIHEISNNNHISIEVFITNNMQYNNYLINKKPYSLYIYIMHDAMCISMMQII